MPERRLILLALLLGLAAALYLGWGLRAPYGFILSLRAVKMAALVVVGLSVGVATVLFQTICGNRLLTPGIVGFDALFIFLQSLLVLVLGAAGVASIPVQASFLVETLCLAGAGVALFGLLLRRGADDLMRMILTGVILGVLLRGLSGFVQRMMAPTEYSFVQQLSFAVFSSVDAAQLAMAALVAAPALVAALRLAPSLDLALLGRTPARAVGLDHDRLVLAALGLVAVLVACSTALVGPVTFLGLLAASLAHAATGDWRHRILLPAAGLIGASILVAGQFVFERLLGYQSSLAIVVEFVGGMLFLFLVLRRAER